MRSPLISRRPPSWALSDPMDPASSCRSPKTGSQTRPLGSVLTLSATPSTCRNMPLGHARRSAVRISDATPDMPSRAFVFGCPHIRFVGKQSSICSVSVPKTPPELRPRPSSFLALLRAPSPLPHLRHPERAATSVLPPPPSLPLSRAPTRDEARSETQRATTPNNPSVPAPYYELQPAMRPTVSPNESHPTIRL